MRFLRRIAPALLLLLAPAAAQADERIHHFVSDAQINHDSSLDVTETIDVNSEHDQIRHGIYRDFPTRYRASNGGQIRVGFTFEGATLDGQPVQAATESIANGVRVKIGNPDALVPEGEHRYVIHYRTTRQIGRFKDFDELYWNATGTGWIFPIDVAEARIRLPAPVRFGQRAAYTGGQGATGSDATVIEDKPGEIAFQTTRPLGAYEGLTVAAAFPKGVVAEPSASSYWLADYGPPALGLIAFLALCFYFYIAWTRAGRDPRAGTVVPIFAPPDDLSPAGMRYMTKLGADNRTFASALVDMGVRGHVKLVEEDRGWLSGKKIRLERLTGAKPLSDEEEAALDCLCRPGESIMMEQKNHEEFSAAKTSLGAILKTKYEGRMFLRNYGWAAAGLLLWFAAMWFAAAAVGTASGSVETWQIVTVIGSLVVVALLWLAFHDSTAGKCLLSLLGVAAVTLATSLGFPVFAAALNSGWYLPLLLPALALPLVISAFWWISAPTKEGRAMLDHIAGFKQYLSITERERLDRMTPPEDTPQLFEKFLPHAIALGVENRWASRFATVLAAAAAQGQQGFIWYSGSSSPWSNPTGFADSMGSSLASTISSASTAPGSSSGSGGGGFSGGGGGGGGGGGW